MCSARPGSASAPCSRTGQRRAVKRHCRAWPGEWVKEGPGLARKHSTFKHSVCSAPKAAGPGGVCGRDVMHDSMQSMQPYTASHRQTPGALHSLLGHSHPSLSPMASSAADLVVLKRAGVTAAAAEEMAPPTVPMARRTAPPFCGMGWRGGAEQLKAHRQLERRPPSNDPQHTDCYVT